jgi:hypothetical protein
MCWREYEKSLTVLSSGTPICELRRKWMSMCAMEVVYACLSLYSIVCSPMHRKGYVSVHTEANVDIVP